MHTYILRFLLDIYVKNKIFRFVEVHIYINIYNIYWDIYNAYYVHHLCQLVQIKINWLIYKNERIYTTSFQPFNGRLEILCHSKVSIQHFIFRISYTQEWGIRICLNINNTQEINTHTLHRRNRGRSCNPLLHHAFTPTNVITHI